MRPTASTFAQSRRAIVIAFILGSSLAILSSVVFANSPGPPVVVAHVAGAVDPVSARYFQRSLSAAEAEHASAFVLVVDTPGGLDTSMRQMVQALLTATVPTIAYVAPDGAHAASAGVFITEAANLVAMAPTTTIGSAHPVNGNGSNIGSDLRDKITNDAVAYMTGIAKQRGRNQAWLDAAVTKSVSVDAQQAKRLQVADYVAPNLPALLQWVDGKTVKVGSDTVTIHTAGRTVQNVDMTPFELIFQRIVDPNVAYLLLTVGFYALLIELFHPGALAPGITGAVCLILAFVAFSTLPMNWGGVLLIMVAVALFVLDIKAAAHGLLTVAGIVSFVLGTLLLYSPPGPHSPASPAVSVALPVLVAAVGLALAVSVLIVGAAIRIARRGPITGIEHISGALGVASSALDPTGTIRVAGQLWSAHANDGPINPGAQVRVLSRRGLTLEVEPVDLAGVNREEEALP